MAQHWEMIHIFVGTKAQYIKTAPIIKALAASQQSFRLIDSGQHYAFAQNLRQELGVREPDYQFRADGDVRTVKQAVKWGLRILWLSMRKRFLKETVFGNFGGICVVHGDTPSTLLAMWVAKRADIPVAHLEAGLRSGSILNPFPEEIIRLIVMRNADLLFAPSMEAAINLRRMGVKGDIVKLPANSVVESLHEARENMRVTNAAIAFHQGLTRPDVVITCHRVENLHVPSRLRRLVRLATAQAQRRRVLFVLHPPTKEALGEEGVEELRRAGVVTSPLLPYAEFIELLASARFVITDGGSIQEECAILGVPTLLWRRRTERSDGIGRNIVLSRLRSDLIDRFLDEFETYRHPTEMELTEPSTVVVNELLENLN